MYGTFVLYTNSLGEFLLIYPLSLPFLFHFVANSFLYEPSTSVKQ